MDPQSSPAQAPLACLDALDEAAFEVAMFRCCGSRAWARRLVEGRPYTDQPALEAAAVAVWERLGPGDWREAFGAHPRIGGHRGGGWEAAEQAGVNDGEPALLDELRRANEQYEARFGHVFLVNATGKSAAEMLAICKERLGNDPAHELRVAARQQLQITLLRLRKLVAEGAVAGPGGSLSTHVLDVSSGAPACGVVVSLLLEGCEAPAVGVTDSDGRVRALLPPHADLPAGVHRLVFDTGRYFAARGIEAFHPRVEIHFEVRDPSAHHHVPLLVSPFSFTTYRGS